jgi:hypothetical protein
MLAGVANERGTVCLQHLYIYYMHIIGLPRLGKVHFIHKTLREPILLPFSGDYFTLILVMSIYFMLLATVGIGRGAFCNNGVYTNN